MLEATNVQMGLSTKQGYHFLLITFSKQPTTTEVTEICDRLHAHFHKSNPFFQREYVLNQVQIRPSLGSAKNMLDLHSAVEEYQTVLKALGLTEWIDDLHFSGDLRPFEEREFLPQPYRASKQLHTVNSDGLAATCLLPG